MRIFVTVKSHKKENKVEKIDQTHFIVWTKELPIKGKANNSAIKLLAKQLVIPPSAIYLKSGAASNRKIFEINSIF